MLIKGKSEIILYLGDRELGICVHTEAAVHSHITCHRSGPATKDQQLGQPRKDPQQIDQS